MAAHALVEAGWKVLLLERGDWVSRGPHNWDPESVGDLTPHYSTETPYLVIDEAGTKTAGAYHCVGGPSVFYGGVALRFRAEDFEYNPEIAEGSDARWPLDYSELEPHYAAAERLLGVAGDGEDDPTAPPRSSPYPQRPADLAPVSRRIDRAARELGYRPSRLPLAINYAPGACRSCGTCDGFACAVSAKNDLATAVIGPLLLKGLRLETNVVVTRLQVEGNRITGVETAHRVSGRREVHRGKQVVVAAGALATPHLLLASGLEQHNPAGHVVGRYLMRHYNEITFGIFPQPPNPGGGFHKQLWIHDFYFGHPSVPEPRKKLGALQQLATPPVALVRAHLPRLVGNLCAPWVNHLTGLLVMAEDQPLYENRVTLDSSERDQYGRRRAVVH
ncbi:MAG: GMC family oxidoreductase N-terminal domain-containing protein, partial [Gemmatimonadales bacterium]